MLALFLVILLILLIVAVAILLMRLIDKEKQNVGLTERLNFAESRLKEEQEKNLVSEAERRRREEEVELRFKSIAGEIMESNSRRFREQNELRMAEILNPLKDNLEKFSKSVSDAYSNEARERFALEKQLREMIELNKSIGTEARQLTNALRGDTKIQGDWGEMILERILEKSGLKKDYHFTVQQTKDESGNTIRNEEGRHLRPDVVVYYPDGRCIVIDSKVSLTAYTDMVNAGSETVAEAAKQRHVASVRENMNKLAGKNYSEYLGDKKSDFVMMFIPNEGAYLAAMNAAPSLWEEAYDKRVVIISPTHLISALRMIEQLWIQDDIKRNVLTIAEEGGKMYDKFTAFVEDMTTIGKELDQAHNAYENAFNKLSKGNGNLVRRAENLKKLGAKASKKLPQQLLEED